MSLSTNSDRSGQDPPNTAGLRSPLYGTATFTSLSPSSVPAPLSPSNASSSRLSYPSRSATPVNSDDTAHMRRCAASPSALSYDSRRHSSATSDPDTETSHSQSYTEYNENDNSFDDSAEVEEVLSRIDDDASQAPWSSGYSSSGHSSGTGSFATATTEPLNFDRERRVLSTISERTESQSLNTGAGIFQNLFSSTFSRPTSLFSSAARTFYGAPASPLSPPPSLQTARPDTPERTFKPAPPTGRRVGNLIASFESSASESDISSGFSRPGSVPLGPRSPSPYSTSRPSSPQKTSRAGTGVGLGLGLSAPSSTATHSLSSFLSPPAHASTFSRLSQPQTQSSETITAGTERPRSPLSSVRNIVAAWKERSPEKASTATRSSASGSVASGPSFTSSSSASASAAPFGFGEGFFSLRRRVASLGAGNTLSRRSGTSAPSYGDFESSSVSGSSDRRSFTDTQSLARSDSQRSAASGSVFDMSELASFVRGGLEPLRVGQLWYLNVHAPPPFRWQRCRAVLYPNTLLLSWLAPGGGRGVITLDLVNCNEVRSVPSPSHPSARDDIGTVAVRLQMDEQDPISGEFDLVEMLCPFQLLYSDGVERLGAESARERVRWVSAIWEALDRSVGPPDRSMTRSPIGSIRTVRSATSSVVSSGSGSASTTYLPPMDSISDLPDIPDFGDSSYTQTQSPRHSLSSFTSFARTRATDDGSISSSGYLHPLDARTIEIAPSRSSSLRRTSSLADLDAEFASALSASGISIRNSRPRAGSSRFSARWTREPSESSSSLGTMDFPESTNASGITRRVPASSFYSNTLSPVTQATLEPFDSDTGTQVVPSTLSLRRSASNSLLGDSHSGPETTTDTRSRSPTTPTRSGARPESLYTTTSGLSRQSAVRRRTPRTARTYSGSGRSGPGSIPSESSDKENDYELSSTRPTRSEADATGTWGACETSQWSSLESRSDTATSYDYSKLATTRAASESEESTVLRPRGFVTTPEKPGESESEEDVFHTPTPSSRTATSYRSVPGTPTPSVPSLSSTEYETALKVASTEYETAEVCPTEPPSTEYTTAEVCPSTPPLTEYLTAECRCKPAAPSIPEEIGTLTPSLSYANLPSERPAKEETLSLYAPSTVPSIPSVIEEAEIPLPHSEVGSEEESPSLFPVELEKTLSRVAQEPVTPSSELTAQDSSTVPPTPVVEPPTPSLLPTVSSTTVTTTSSVTPTAEPGAPVSPSPSSPSTASIPQSPSSPSSPVSLSFKSESSKSPKTKSLYVPSQSSIKSAPSVSDDYDSSFLAPSPSMHSIPLQDPVDVSFETSFFRPSMSELYSDQMPSPFMPKDPAAISTTATPTATTTNSTSSLERTQSSMGLYNAPPVHPMPVSLGTTTTPTSLSMEDTVSISSLTPSSAFPSQTSVSGERSPTPSSLTRSDSMHSRSISGGERTATPSSLTPSSAIYARSAGSPGQTVAPSSLTPSSAFGDESVFGQTVTVSRTPSSVSSISMTSMTSSVFAPTSLYEESLESPSTVPTLLSSRATTPRPMTPAGVPLPSSPSLISSVAPTASSISVSTPRTDAPSIHTLTSIAASDLAEAPREEILTHDVNRLLRYLHDLDQIRGGETLDLKDHLGRIEDELRDLSDFLRQPEPQPAVPKFPVKDQSVNGSVRVSGPRTLAPEPTGRRSVVSEPISHRTVTPGAVARDSLRTHSTTPLPVPEPRPRDQAARREEDVASATSVTPPPRVSLTYSPSTISEGMSFLSSHHSDDFSLMSLEDYPAVPMSTPSSPSSPSSSGWSSSSTEAAWPPSSVTPSSDPRSSLLTHDRGYVPEDLTPESPLRAATPVPAASPLASIISRESALPPPFSMTPSLPTATATPLPESPLPAGPTMASPLPASSPSSSPSSESPASLPPSSSTPSLSARSLSPSMLAPPSVVHVRQPTSPVLSLSPELPESPLPPSPASLGIAIMSASPSPQASPVLRSPLAFPEPEIYQDLSPSPTALPVPPGSELPEPVVGPPSPSLSIVTARPPSSTRRSMALEGLRDLLEDLRGQTQALWDGQLSTNRMLDDLVARGPALVTAPDGSEEEVRNRLHNIEGLLGGILRDLARSGEGREETEPSELSSETSSALRRYIDRLRDPHRHDATRLHMPTPSRAPPANLDSEWLDFLSAPPPGPDQAIQGPPPLVPLIRRATRRSRLDSVSPPPSIPSPIIRTRSAPLDETIREADEPRVRERDVRRHPWIWPRIRQGVRRPFTPSESGQFYDRPGFETWRPGRAAPTRPLSDAEIDFLERVRRHRQDRNRGGDGFFDATRQRPTEPQPIVLEEVPPAPPRVHSAPPEEHFNGTWYRPQIPPGGRPGTTMVDAPTIVPTPAAPPPQPFHQPMQPGVLPSGPMPMPMGAPGQGMPVPVGIPMGGPPPPFNEMLDLLRQNRLAQTASIDQQREIMRYMRGLNQWLEHDVRDRQNEMRSIGARVDALRGELGRLGFQPTGMPMPMPVPPAEQGQPQGPSGQTFIIPPHIPPQPGVGFSPGPGVIPQGPMPMPGPGFPQPERPFTPGREGGPPVIPPFVAGPGGPPTSMEGFIPPRPSDMGMGPVIPDFSHFPRPGMPTPMPQSAYGDPSRFEYEEPPFVPPRPQMGVGSPMMPVPPPFMGPGQQQPMQPITVLPPPESRPDIHVVAPSDRTSTSSGSDRSLSPPRGHGDIHVHVPPSQPPLMAPGGMPGPPEAPPAVVRVPEGPVVGSPLHPAVQMQPSIIPTQAQGQQPFIVTAPTPAPTVPTDFPHEPIIIRSDGRRSRSSYRSASPGRDQPTVVVVPGPSSHRHRSRSPRSHVPTHVLIRSDPRYSPRSRSSSPRVQRVDTQRSRYSDRPRSHRHSRSYSRSPERRHRPRREDRDRSRSYSPDRRHRRRSRSYTPDDGRPHRRGRSRSRSPIIVQTGAPSGFTPSQQPPIVIPPPRSRSSSRSQGRPIILQPMQPPLPVLQGDQPHVQQPLQPPIGIPSQGTMLPDPGLGRHPSYPTYTRRSQSPSRYEPTQVPSQTPIVIHTTAERERSPRRHEDDDGVRRRRSRSYSESPQRRRRPPREREDDDGGRRRRRRSYSESPERRDRSPREREDDDGGRRRRPRPRSYSESPGRRDRSPREREDDDGGRRRRRRPRSYSESPGRRDRSPREREDDGGRHRRRRSYSGSPRRRQRSPTAERDRPSSPRRERYRSPRRERDDREHLPGRRTRSRGSRTPPGTERDGGRATPPLRLHRSPSDEREPRTVTMPSRRPSYATHAPSYVEGDAGDRRPSHERAPSSPTRVLVHSTPAPVTVIRPQPTGVSYHPSEIETQFPLEDVTGGVHRIPSQRHPIPASPHPTDVSYLPTGPVYEPPVSEAPRPVIPPYRDQLHMTTSDTEPIIPVVPSETPHRRPVARTEVPFEDVPGVSRLSPSPPPVGYPRHPLTPSGPGDLALHEALHAHQERLEEQERHLEELGRAAIEAEERREQHFRDHEDERNRLFQENEERRERELAEAKEECARRFQDIAAAPPIEPPFAPPAAEGRPHVAESEGTIASHVTGSPSIAARPIPPPGQVAFAEPIPQLQEILELLRNQQAETVETKVAEAERFDALRDEIADARAEAKQECEERIRMLEEELARTREELELERGQRKAEELERIERERADVIERDEAVRNQLGDITNIVQEQREDCVRKRELMDERWEEKQMRREHKQARSDTMYEMLERVLQDREQERAERELERAAAAERPSIETVLEELKRQNDQQIDLINNLTDTWRADSARQHQETIEAVKASAQEMVPYNLTGYLDEFSKALAGEIRTLLGEVGRLHEQKRTLQFEIHTLMHMYSQYGPGGQFEPDWRPTMGPLAGPPMPGFGDLPPGGPGGPGGPPPPGPDEPPPPAKPAWRTVQQRVPRRKRTGKSETLAPPPAQPVELMQERQPSWATWQPNPSFAPTPPPPGASPLVVPPSGPTGLFGPRSPRNTMYGAGA